MTNRFPALLGLLALAINAAYAQDHDHHDHEAAPPASATSEADHQGHGDHAGHGGMRGLLGPYPMTRDGSGTSWLPDSAPMSGIHGQVGDWSTMFHGYAFAVYDDQGGGRGDTKSFTASMFMASAQRQAAGGTLGLRGMFSLDPTMGKGGYPLLFQTGETADGTHPLIDRQHPHDFVMELAGIYSRPMDEDSSWFLYGGLAGEPALGPPAFMHRFHGMANPEAPLTHHWLDATHITFGVITAGVTWQGWKLEASTFHGREPDEQRWNLDMGKLDSASARLTWNPTRNWSLQVSHGYIESPEQLEPEISVRRTTASATHDADIALGHWQTTLAWGRNDKDPGDATDGWLLESALKVRNAHTVFARYEHVQKDELFDHHDARHGQTFTVDKLSVGYMYDFYRVKYATFAIGGLVSGHRVPEALESVYGTDPTSYMVYVQARLE